VNRAGPTLGDGLLLALLAAGLGALYAALWRPAVTASHAEIYVDGRSAGRLDLASAGTHRYRGARGDSVLQVEAGRIRFIDGPCRNRVCIYSGWLSESGDGTACLPNRVSLTLRGRGGVDAVSY
jgi:hypothetical protein